MEVIFHLNSKSATAVDYLQKSEVAESMIPIDQNCDKLMLIKNHSLRQISQNDSIQIHREIFFLIFAHLSISVDVCIC